MQVHNLYWHALINNVIKRDKSSDHPSFLIPGLIPQIPSPILELIQKAGCEEIREMPEKSSINSLSPDYLYIVRKGLIAREITWQHHSKSIELAPLGTFAYGERNIFSRIPTPDNFFAIAPSQLIRIERKLLISLLKATPNLFQPFASYVELSSLNQRLTLVALSTLPAQERVKMFFLGWTLCYGNLVTKENNLWVTVPFPVQRKYLRLCTKTSKACLDNILAEWKKNLLLEREGHLLLIKPHLLTSAYDWLTKDMKQCLPASIKMFFKTV